jgi:prevent-host-death family protein
VKSVGLFEAKSHFSAIILEVEGGQSIIVTKKGKPVARIVPFTHPEQPREIGFDDGKIWMSDDFNELPPELLEAFGGS